MHVSKSLQTKTCRYICRVNNKKRDGSWLLADVGLWSKSAIVSYADDTTLVSSIGQLELRHPNGNLCDIINTELGKVNDWLRVNKLPLNVGKTKFMIFHKKGKKLLIYR